MRGATIREPPNLRWRRLQASGGSALGLTVPGHFGSAPRKKKSWIGFGATGI